MTLQLMTTNKKSSSSSAKDSWLKNHHLLYMGRRMAVIDNRSRSLTDEDYDLIIWDRALECIVAWGDFNQDGSLSVSAAYGPHEMSIDGSTPKELAMNATQTINWILKN